MRPAKGTVDWGVHGWNEAGFARKGPCTLHAYAAKDGRELWSAPCTEGYNSPVDVFVVDGIVWVGTGIQGPRSEDGRGGQDDPNPRRQGRHAAPPLLSQQGLRAVHLHRPVRHRSGQPGRRLAGQQQLGPRHVPVRDHPGQRFGLRPARRLCLLPDREGPWLLRRGPATGRNRPHAVPGRARVGERPGLRRRLAPMRRPTAQIGRLAHVPPRRVAG